MTRPSPWLVANLLAQLALGLLAMTICIPSMQEWAGLLHTTQPQVQLTFSAYAVTYGALQLLYGPLSDRLGRRPVLLFGLALGCLGSVAAALAPDIGSLIAARALQGAGTAAGMVVGRALVQDLFAGPERTRMMAYVGMAMGLCPPLATVLGGQVHVHLHWRLNFVLMAALGLALFVAAWRGLPGAATKAPRAGQTEPGGPQGPAASDGPHPAAAPPVATPVAEPHWLRAMGRAYRRLAGEARFRLYVLLLAMTNATFYAFLAGAPIVLASLGVRPDGIGFVIMLVPMSYIAGNFATTRLVKHLGEPRMMALGQALTLASIVLMLALGLAGWRSPAAFAAPLMLLGLGHGLLVPAALAGTVGQVPALAGAAAAVLGLMQQLMGALGGWAVGLMPHDGTVNLGALMLGLALVGAAAQAGLHRRR